VLDGGTALFCSTGPSVPRKNSASPYFPRGEVSSTVWGPTPAATHLKNKADGTAPEGSRGAPGLPASVLHAASPPTEPAQDAPESPIPVGKVNPGPHQGQRRLPDMLRRLRPAVLDEGRVGVDSSFDDGR
jgi:hypothetical protein